VMANTSAPLSRTRCGARRVNSRFYQNVPQNWSLAVAAADELARGADVVPSTIARPIVPHAPVATTQMKRARVRIELRLVFAPTGVLRAATRAIRSHQVLSGKPTIPAARSDSSTPRGRNV